MILSKSFLLFVKICIIIVPTFQIKNKWNDVWKCLAQHNSQGIARALTKCWQLLCALILIFLPALWYRGYHISTQVVFTSHSKLPDHSIVMPYDGTNTLSNLPASSFVTAHQHSPLTFVKLLVSSNFLYKSRPQLWGREDSQISDLHEQCLLECCRAVQKA